MDDNLLNIIALHIILLSDIVLEFVILILGILFIIIGINRLYIGYYEYKKGKNPSNNINLYKNELEKIINIIDMIVIEPTDYINCNNEHNENQNDLKRILFDIFESHLLNLEILKNNISKYQSYISSNIPMFMLLNFNCKNFIDLFNGINMHEIYNFDICATKIIKYIYSCPYQLKNEIRQNNDIYNNLCADFNNIENNKNIGDKNNKKLLKQLKNKLYYRGELCECYCDKNHLNSINIYKNIIVNIINQL